MDNESNIVGGEEEIILEPEMFGGVPGTTDFNELENRPSYAGEVMTGETNIPAVPTAVSQLTNDSGYQTANDVTTAVGLETTARENADNGLQGQIDALAAASDVTDIVGTKAELEAYDTSKLKNNDIIKVLQDESEDDETTYYRWSTTTETFTLIGAEGPYYTKSATDQLLQAKQDKLTAGANITIDENNEISANDTTYTAGTNVQISEQNVISATDTTYSDFTGTDGVDAGVAGLVPAPATTDVNKYLKSDGTWETVATGPTVVQTEGSSITDVMSQAAVTAMKGKAKVLTTDDYNYPTTTPTKIALWLLPTGIYEIGSGVIVAMNATVNDSTGGLYIVSNTSGYGVQVIRMRRNTRAGVTYWVTTQGGTDVIKNEVLRPEIVNNLTTSASGSVLDAAQGKVLKDTIDGLITKNAGAPTTSTVGTVGKLIEDTTNGKLYICTDTTGGSYTWVEVGAGGGGITELTSADYNYPTDNPDGVALWKLESGVYYALNGVKIYPTTAGADSFNHGGTAIVGELGSTMGTIVTFNSYNGAAYMYQINPSTGAKYAATSLVTTIIQSTGTSQTSVMSQNATTSMIFADPSTKRRIAIGDNAQAGGSSAVASGRFASASGESSIALGFGAQASVKGQFDVGLHGTWTSYGYNSSDYRLLTGLYDGQSAHDAVTKGQLDSIAIKNAGAPTTSTVGTVGQLLEDTTNGKLYICTAVTPGTDPDPDTYTWTEVGAGGGSSVIELTSSDYDYPANNPDGVALWKLPIGLYTWGDSVNSGKVYYNSSETSSPTQGSATYLVSRTSGGFAVIYKFDSDNAVVYTTNTSTGASFQKITTLMSSALKTTTGTSDTAIMSQKATTSMIYADPSTKHRIQVGVGAANNHDYSIVTGEDASENGNNSIAIGRHARAGSNGTVALGGGGSSSARTEASGEYSTAVGFRAKASANGAISLGAFSSATAVGEMNIGTSFDSYGYNNSTYRLLSGVYDGQSNHDAATVAQGNKLMTAAPTTTDAGVLGQLWTDTTAMHTYQLTSIDTTDPDNPSYVWTQRW